MSMSEVQRLRNRVEELEAHLEYERGLVAIYRDGMRGIGKASTEVALVNPDGASREVLVALLARLSEALRYHDYSGNAYRLQLAQKVASVLKIGAPIQEEKR